MQKILIYVDSGTDGTTRLMRAIAQQLPPAMYEIRAVMADDIRYDTTLFDDAVVFVMPGGADLPFCAALNGAPNARIRRFVEDGGVYWHLRGRVLRLPGNRVPHRNRRRDLRTS